MLHLSAGSGPLDLACVQDSQSHMECKQLVLRHCSRVPPWQGFIWCGCVAVSGLELSSCRYFGSCLCWGCMKAVAERPQRQV